MIVVVEVVVARLAALELAHAADAGPIRVHRSGITIVAATPAVGDVRLQIGLVRERSVAIGIDAARVGRAGWSDRTIALNRTTRAGLGARPAGARRTHGRRWRNVALARGIGRRLTAGAVDGAVAIVVDAIARFGARIDGPNADDGPALALLGAVRTRENVRRAARARGIGRVVVDQAVAVVIDAVACFGAGIDGANADERAVLTLLHAIFTRPDVGLSALNTNARRVVVDDAVTIVIDAIARFGLRIDGSNAHQTAGLALVRPVRTGSGVRRAALRASSDGRVVDDAVAIVVLPVARFRLRVERADAHQVARLALDGSETAREGVALAARNARTLRLVVDGAVAVVVDPVTRFRRGIDGSDADRLPILALHRAKRARRSSALSALRAYAADVVVDRAVAIVVDSIACFRCRVPRAHALQRATHALNHAQHTRRGTRLTARNAGSLRCVVDHAIAIVIDAVADFHRRIDIAHTHDLRHLALRHAERARRDVARSARTPDIGWRVIRGTIAIVVQTIACFEGLILDQQTGADAHGHTTLAFGCSGMDRRGTFAIGIAITHGPDGHVHRQVIGGIDFAVAIVVEPVAEFHAVVRDVALVFATRGVRIVEVPEAIPRTRAIALQNLALRIGVRARHRAIVDTLRCAMNGHAITAALAAIRGARAQIDVLVLDPVAIVVLVVADVIDVRTLDAVVFAGLVVVEVVIVLRTHVALAYAWLDSRSGTRRALDRRNFAVDQLGEAIVRTRAAPLNAREVDHRTHVRGSVAIVIEIIAHLDAAVGRGAPASAACVAPEDAPAFASSAGRKEASGSAIAACCRVTAR